MDLIIKNGYIVSAEYEGKFDIGIEDGKIVSIKKNLKYAKEIIDANGKFVFPGVIDPHVHFQLKAYGDVSNDDFENGSKSAIAGGVTTIIDFAIPQPQQSLIDAIEKRIKEADGNIYTDYSLHCQIIEWNANTRKEIKDVIKYGINSFKIFMPRTENWFLDDGSIYNLMKEISKYDALLLVHAENADLVENFTNELIKNKKISFKYFPLSRPNIVESEAVNRIIFYSKQTRCKIYIVHLTTKEGLEIISNYKMDAKIYAETCPQYLLLTNEVFKKKDGYIYCACPPIKQKKDKIALWNGINSGIIDVIATDSCTFTKKQKKPFKNDFTKMKFGLPGVETLLPIIFSEGHVKRKIPLRHLIKLLTYNPAKIFRLYPKKGGILKNSDADIVIFDPSIKYKIDYKNMFTNCDYSPYQDMLVTGKVTTTICRGKVFFNNGIFSGEKNGSFIKRSLK